MAIEHQLGDSLHKTCTKDIKIEGGLVGGKGVSRNKRGTREGHEG